MESRTIARGGIHLHGLWRSGEGPPLVIVAGAMADSHDFVPVAESIGYDGPLLIVDRRGRGRSGPQGSGYSLLTEVADLRAWIDAIGGPVILVGWSLGGTIVLETAARDDRVTFVVAYDPVLPPFAAEAVPSLAAADLDERVAIINRDISGLPAEHVAAMRETQAWTHLRELAAPLATELEALNSFTPGPDWAEVDASFIVGEHSQGIPPYGPAFERAAAVIPSADVTVLTGHGHLAHVENPELLGVAIGRLFRSEQ